MDDLSSSASSSDKSMTSSMTSSDASLVNNPLLQRQTVAMATECPLTSHLHDDVTPSTSRTDTADAACTNNDKTANDDPSPTYRGTASELALLWVAVGLSLYCKFQFLGVGLP